MTDGPIEPGSSRILHIVGARPNFMKAAPVIRALGTRDVSQRLVHTGQHYDERMSDIFFRELELPQPDRNLGIGSGSHAVQTAAMMVALESEILATSPELVVVYGDVNSTTAAAIVAAKLHVPLAHVESGLRSFDMSMPEEVNRRITDVLADLLLVTAPEGIEHLREEGIPDDRVHYVGNPMIDTLLRHRPRFDAAGLRDRLALSGPHAVATIHRPSNVDDHVAARRIADMLYELADLITVVVPLHPRGREAMEAAGLHATRSLRVVDPLGYVDFMSLVAESSLVVTDSGGIQEETTVLGIPCLTVRPNTERPVTITHGTNRLAEPEAVADLARGVLEGAWTPPARRPPLWDGRAGERVAEVIMDWLGSGGQPATSAIEWARSRANPEIAG